MSGTTSTIILWLFVMNLGIAFGAGLYEHRIVVSHWISASEESGTHWHPDAVRRDDVGLRFWAFVTTGPLTLLTLANLFTAWRASGALRGWWIAAGVTALADRVFTFSYFIPTLLGLMRATDSPEAVEVAVRWWNLNYLRQATVLVAWLAAMRTFALLYQQRG